MTTKLIAWTLIIAAMVLWMCKTPAFGAAEGKNAAYNPDITYSGDYKPVALYFKYTEKDFWRINKKMDKLSNVVCTGALASLKKNGTWRGRFNADGSCGSPTEPLFWSLGNRLNYEELQEQGAR